MTRRKRTVIILDDEPIVCERLKPALEKVGFEVETFGSSQAAIDRLAETRFDVLITDLKMEGPDGLDVLRFARDTSPTTKVIVITGFATVETARDAMRYGAIDFIAKPFKIGQLRDLVMSITGTPTSEPE